jgi:hypothetical protein
MSDLDELQESTWASMKRRIDDSVAEVRVLALDGTDPRIVLEKLGVSDRSTMGALASHVGALLVDHGWLRVLAGGCALIPGIVEANHLAGEAPPFLFVAEDVLGGRFAIDGGGLGIAPGAICYFGPDTLEWIGIGGGYSAFVGWMLSGELTEFYSELRWSGWEQETANLPLNKGISLFPPPFTAEGRAPGGSSRRPVAITELQDFYSSAASQVAALGVGQRFRLTFEDQPQ